MRLLVILRIALGSRVDTPHVASPWAAPATE
jgi:hypothetical protein